MTSSISLLYAAAGFVGLITLFAFAGAIHGFMYWGADRIRIGGIIYFGLNNIWNFCCDIALALELLNHEDTQYLFYIYIVFIVVPSIVNMISLRKYQQKWSNDDAIRERVSSWFVRWQILTYALAALSGSAFGTIELVNSYVFGLDFFCMGLNEIHLKRFKIDQLLSIILRNLPQLIVQFWFLSLLDWKPRNKNVSMIIWVAIIDSCSTLVMGCLYINTAKKIFKVLDLYQTVSCCINIASEEIKIKTKQLQVSTYALRDVIAETLIMHPRSVEIYFPIATADGLKVSFSVWSSKLEPDAINSRLKETAELSQKIKTVWRLATLPSITLEDIVVNGVIGVDKENLHETSRDKSASSDSERATTEIH